ncbi:chemotaxis protein CheA [Clostridium manihotivorum]|uniref:Chemotaxis protein CheA n=1 Tax=Clostridium manihotivorum TaxID=2320868 RepID=A0A3R5X4C8_9CLOT|nr:chemotaxis protein CheA [Clostridium manihotivorum]QAA34311.1 chemotaxis protein CheA [Clostridium manihotivorum]
MGESFDKEIIELYISETNSLVEGLERISLELSECSVLYENINEIFRVMHTIKGNSAIMNFSAIANYAHSLEDLFDKLRNLKLMNVDCSKISDFILSFIDYVSRQLEVIENGDMPSESSEACVADIKGYLSLLCDNMSEYSGKNHNPVALSTMEFNIRFLDGCGMENIRAFTIVHNLKNLGKVIDYKPKDIEENEKSMDDIIKDGFYIKLQCEHSEEKVLETINEIAFIKEIEVLKDNKVEDVDNTSSSIAKELVDKEPNTSKKEAISTESSVVEKTVEDIKNEGIPCKTNECRAEEQKKHKVKNETLSVDVDKLDYLFDLVGEIAIAEAAVTKNKLISDIEAEEDETFNKAVRNLRKLIDNMQNTVMAIRMVPLASTFQKMHRLVRDMSKKLNKEVELEIIGEETEVDKSVIEHISDPLMHIIRNSMDHGVEDPKERVKANKSPKGKITLEAKNMEGYVWVVIKDDGKGLDKNKIYEKAVDRGITNKNIEELSDEEIFSFIFAAGLSTNENVTEYSGRGVGMDVVTKNIEKVRGKVSVESTQNVGTTIYIKIPLTLAIIQGMFVKVGQSQFVIPTNFIKECFRESTNEIITDHNGREMVYIRGKTYELIRLSNYFAINGSKVSSKEGIVIMTEYESKIKCIFVDELLGEQQIVIKPLPEMFKHLKYITGCTIMGDGTISLIIDMTTI